MRKLTCVSLLSFGLAAQQQVTVPANFDIADAPSVGELAGANAKMRQQFILGKSLLGSLIGKTVLEIWVRRNAATGESLTGGQADISVEVSECDTVPSSASPIFANNHGAVRTLVFQGRIRIPDSSSVGLYPWATDQTVRIILQQSFSYHPDRNLCIEISGAPVSGARSPSWPLDNARQDVDGAAIPFGTSCIGQMAATAATLRGNDESLIAGATTTLRAYGQYASPGFLLVGTKSFSGGLDLGALGMPLCRLYVDPLVTLQLNLDQTVPLMGANGPGTGQCDIHFPPSSALVGGRMITQFVNWEVTPPFTNPLGVTSSQGLQLNLTSSTMTLDMATVSSVGVTGTQPLPMRGKVAPNRGPVLRFVF